MKYAELVKMYMEVESTSKRLEKTFHVSEFLKTVETSDLPMMMLLLQGRIFPSYDERKIGVAERMVLKAIEVATGTQVSKVEDEWREIGDLGKTAGELVKTKKQVTLFSTELTVKKVFANVQKLPSLEGSGSVNQKIQLIAELLSSATPEEARYVVRTVLEDLRVGIGEGTVRDAIVWSNFGEEAKINYDSEKKSITPEDREKYNKFVGVVQEAYDLLNDFAKVARIAREQGVPGLQSVKLDTGTPLKVMLYQRAKDITDAFARVGKPAAIEFKYDGFRVQIHKFEGKVKFYTRRLEEVTKQFPELRKFVEDHVSGDEFILDAEVLGYDSKTKKYLPFQSISQRIKRKHNIDQMSKDFPVELNVFDIVSYGGENLLKKHFIERRKVLEQNIKEEPFKIVLAKQIITDDEEKANAFYQYALQAGQEGVMFKNLEGIYKPGSRVGYGVKVKPVMESLDLVLVAAEWGTGKRSGWLTSYTLACLDPDSGEFLTIGNVGTGMKELEQDADALAEGEKTAVTFNKLTEMAKELVVDEKGREVKLKPKIVIEVHYEEVQASPKHSSGYALRFPRVVQIREDKPPEEASTIDMVEELYSTQRGRN